MIGIRGAIRVERNDRHEIYHDTQRLLREMLARNGVGREQIVSAFFTMTPDLNADFPAYAARDMGWTDVPMLGAQESPVPGALDRMVRVLLLCAAAGPARHVYLGAAAAMRPDLAEEGDAALGPPVPPPREPELGHVLVVGLGLIGGSLALSLRRSGLSSTTDGFDLSAEAVRLAHRVGAVDAASTDPDWLASVLGRADVVLLAIPVVRAVGWVERWGGRLRPGSVLVDVGSTKTEILRRMERLPEQVEAIGAHPMAGSEQSGMAAARPDLFYGASWALMACGRTGQRARRAAERIVEGTGGRIVWTSADRHDRAVALGSHLPYLLAVALTRRVDRSELSATVRSLVGPGLKDMTRLAQSSPTVMAEILGMNWSSVRGEAIAFREELERLLAELDHQLGEPGAGLSPGPPGEREIATVRERLREASETRERIVAARDGGEATAGTAARASPP